MEDVNITAPHISTVVTHKSRVKGGNFLMSMMKATWLSKVEIVNVHVQVVQQTWLEYNMYSIHSRLLHYPS